jgi:hypothetical protein
MPAMAAQNQPDPATGESAGSRILAEWNRVPPGIEVREFTYEWKYRVYGRCQLFMRFMMISRYINNLTTQLFCGRKYLILHGFFGAIDCTAGRPVD